MRWAVDTDDRVLHLTAGLREAFLQHGLVVDVRVDRVVELGLEGADDRCSNRLEAERQIEGAEQGFEYSRDDVAVCGQALELLDRQSLAARCELLAETELQADLGAAVATDDVGAKLGELTLAVLGEALVRGLGDREAKHAVTEELEPLVAAAALGGPRGVCERLLA